jgi:methionyl-tRNA formyltransferase
MSSRSPERKSQRIVFFGMRCAFSIPPLAALIEAGHNIVGVVLPGPPFGPPMLLQHAPSSLPFHSTDEGRSDIETLAVQAGVQALSIGNLGHPTVVRAVADLDPDLFVTACFPALLPPEMLNIPRLGALNVHSSLLPRGRGPEPLFWTFRRGEDTSGVTIHVMDDRFDHGPIFLQEAVTVPDGVRLPDFERQLAVLGSELLVRAVDQLTTDLITPIPQNEVLATTAPFPRPPDFLVPTDLPAKWAYNFVRAVAPTTGRLSLNILEANHQFPIVDAISYDEEATVDSPFEIDGDRLTARFQNGVVTFRLSSI